MPLFFETLFLVHVKSILRSLSTKFMIQGNLPHQKNAEGTGCAVVSRQQIHHLRLR